MLFQEKTLNMMYPTAIFTNDRFYSVSIHLILERNLFISKYCKDLNVKVIFYPFKLCNIFSPKDFISDSLKSRVVCKFTCAGCGARYVVETMQQAFLRTCK